jgi:hypothetical protein
LNGQSDPRYHPPTDYCGTANPLNVDFSKPHDQDANLPTGTYTVQFSANSSSAITQVILKLNGSQICTFNNGANNYSCDVNFSGNGVYTIEANAMDAANHSSSRTITVAVGQAMPTPTPTPSPT